MRVLARPYDQRGLHTVIGLMRGAGHAEAVIELFLLYIGVEWHAGVLFERAGHLLAPAYAVSPPDAAALGRVRLPVHSRAAVAELFRKPAIMAGRLSSGDREHELARLLLGKESCEALAMSIVVGSIVRYVLFACRDLEDGPAQTIEYQLLLSELSEHLGRLEGARGFARMTG